MNRSARNAPLRDGSGAGSPATNDLPATKVGGKNRG